MLVSVTCPNFTTIDLIYEEPLQFNHFSRSITSSKIPCNFRSFQPIGGAAKGTFAPKGFSRSASSYLDVSRFSIPP